MNGLSCILIPPALSGPLALLLAGYAGLTLRRARPTLRGTTLVAAWYWTALALAAWVATTLVHLLLPDSLRNWCDQVSYASCVLTLCPFISVLGSRRPTNRVWNGFIILPLILVLEWPAVTAMTSFPYLRPLHLQAPVLIGFVLVGVMGAGNYLGTRYGLAACLGAASVAPALLKFTDPVRFGSWNMWPLSVLFFCGGMAWAARQARAASPYADRRDCLWNDFRETFGMVWSKRLEERINVTANEERWCARLEGDRFVWSDESSPMERLGTERRIDHTLRWLLRRFVDPEWIDRRLKSDEVQGNSFTASDRP